VIYRLGGFSRNLRNEVTRSGKWYFYDNGIRNAVIGNFQPLTSRTDVGMLWENYLISERLKLNNNLGWHNQYYFWRTYAQNEVDLIEEHESGSLSAYEFKWGNKHPAVPAAFAKGYPDATFTVVSRQNYLTDFILPG
jgi:predicted AAA+ superfamily ATPase